MEAVVTGTSNTFGMNLSNLFSRLAGWRIVAMIAMLLVSVLPAISRAEDAEAPADETSTQQPAETPAATPSPATPSQATPSNEATEATEEAAEPVQAQSSNLGGVSDEQLATAEARAKEAEIAYLAATLKLEQLRTQRRVAELSLKLNDAQSTLTTLTSIDAEGFIKKWLVAGPIHLDEKVSNHDEESNKDYLDREYVPAEQSPKEGDTFKIDDVELTWKSAEIGDFAVELNKIAEEEGADAEHAAYLGTAYIIADEQIDGVKLSVGSDDDSVWRLNGEEVIRAYGGRGIDKDQNEAEELTLKKGVNTLSFTVLNGEGPAAAAARFVDEDGNPVRGIKVTTTPPTEATASTDTAPTENTESNPAK